VDAAAVPHDVYVGHLNPGKLVLPEVEDWQFHALKPTLAGDSASPKTGPAAMAMAG
jgi:hypothetical protein